MCLLMFSSPLHRLYSWSVSFRTSKCKHLRSGTTYSFILLLMSKPSDVQIHEAVACPVVVWEANCSSPHMLQTANPLAMSPRCEPFAAKMLTPASWPLWSSNCFLPFITSNLWYFIFNRLDTLFLRVTILKQIWFYYSIKLRNIPFVLLFVSTKWVFVTHSDFLIPISLQPNVVEYRYFKLWILLDPIV